MKKIMITGVNGYIGKSLERWLTNYSERYLVDCISLRNDCWKTMDLSVYDVVLHAAGIAHVKETPIIEELYYKVNRDLAYEVANKAKNDGVNQFILLSSMSVYGVQNGVINENTNLNPKSGYGKSKLEAERLISQLSSNKFYISIVRPPMVYGKNCGGNYPKLVKAALRAPMFPAIDNKRSMIYIDNLCEFLRLLIDDRSKGIFFPQNNEYVNTTELVRIIAESHGKRIRVTKLFNPLLRFLTVSTINKVFGDLVYEKKMSEYSTIQKCNYIGFEESIKLTEA
ncbi:NAD-dependent epimerase/dehydratase family protein [Paenibacillus sp. NRS-1760]|uniref:NAD-dependent epimerase/dehydratase family protein n=1 Tax=Paenibacillus sp. NRS-1760 TaxID=3233902 RepID=UPI003D2D862D